MTHQVYQPRSSRVHLGSTFSLAWQLLNFLSLLLLITVPLSVLLPTNASGLANSLLSLLVMLTSLAVWLGIGLQDRRLTLVSSLFVAFLATGLISLLYSYDLDVVSWFKRVFALLVPVAFFCFPAKSRLESAFLISGAVIWFLFAYTISQPLYYHESEFFVGAGLRRARLWPFFEQSPHSSGYFVGALLLIFYLSLPKTLRLGARVLSWLTISIAVFMMLGFQSSQAIMAFLSFIAGAFVASSQVPKRRKIIVILLIGLAASYVVYDKIMHTVALVGRFEFYSLGSGRVGTWIGRFADFQARDDLVTLLVGTGPGSDIYVGSMWNKETTAHNTFITYMIEYGIVGVITLIAFLIMMLRAFGKCFLPIFLVLIVSSLIGNGILLRPTILILFSFAGYLYFSKIFWEN